MSTQYPDSEKEAKLKELANELASTGIADYGTSLDMLRRIAYPPMSDEQVRAAMGLELPEDTFLRACQHVGDAWDGFIAVLNDYPPFSWIEPFVKWLSERL